MSEMFKATGKTEKNRKKKGQKLTKNTHNKITTIQNTITL